METLQQLDITVFRMINNLAGTYPWLNPGFIFFAEYAIFALALFMLMLWVGKRSMRQPLIIAFIAFVVAALIAKLAGLLFSHMQPFVELPDVFQLIDKKVGNAFPSDHTAAAFAVCVTLFLGSKSKWRALYIVLATMMGIARIWVGVHYPVDVIVGAFIGTLIAFVCTRLLSDNKLIASFIAFYERIEGRLFGAPPRHKRK
jgi:undecaprenyl-diphosphatase